MRILLVGDVVGAPGRRAIEQRLPSLRAELAVDFCVVNGENAADGYGLTARLAERLLAAGADVVTTGNHVWRRADLLALLSSSDRILRPANMGSEDAPGRGITAVQAASGESVAVINLLGSLFLHASIHPFLIVDRLVAQARQQASVVLVDFHAEATSEKMALAQLLDGRVTAVVGTHTHVQTNDARILPGGTAAVTDLGMTGPHDSVIGFVSERAVERMRTGLPVRLEPAERGVRIEGALVECDPDGRASRCELVRIPCD